MHKETGIIKEYEDFIEEIGEQEARAKCVKLPIGMRLEVGGGEIELIGLIKEPHNILIFRGVSKWRTIDRHSESIK